MAKHLGPVQRRVIGVLLEKALATPAYYPMTVNAIVAGCNQRSNRDPEMDLRETDVEDALEALRREGLAVSVHIEGGRTVKWKQDVRAVYGLEERKELAVFTELVLRGAQTKAELKTRAARMAEGIEAADIDRVLERLMTREDPLVVCLGKAQGGRAERYAHTIYLDGEALAVTSPATPPAYVASPIPTSSASPSPSPTPPQPPPPPATPIAALEARIVALEARVAALERA